MPRFSSAKPSISWHAQGTFYTSYFIYVVSHPCESSGTAPEGTENRFKDLTGTMERKADQANGPIKPIRQRRMSKSYATYEANGQRQAPLQAAPKQGQKWHTAWLNTTRTIFLLQNNVPHSQWKDALRIFQLYYVCYMPRPSHITSADDADNDDRTYRLWTSSLRHVLHPPPC